MCKPRITQLPSEIVTCLHWPVTCRRDEVSNCTFNGKNKDGSLTTTDLISRTFKRLHYNLVIIQFIPHSQQYMKFLIVEPSPLPILITLGPKYSPQDPVFQIPLAWIPCYHASMTSYFHVLSFPYVYC